MFLLTGRKNCLTPNAPNPTAKCTSNLLQPLSLATLHHAHNLLALTGHEYTVYDGGNRDTNEPSVRVNHFEKVRCITKRGRERGIQEPWHIRKDTQDKGDDSGVIPAISIRVLPVGFVQLIDIQLGLSDEIVINNQNPGDRPQQ